MNSNDEGFDWHVPGVWVAHDDDNEPNFETMAASPHSCRARLLGQFRGNSWLDMADAGWSIHEYAPALDDYPVLTDVIETGAVRITDQVAVADNMFWRYPANMERAPAGVTVQLLTRGGIAVRGVWNDLGDYIAWAPMLRRDKELEERLGL